MATLIVSWAGESPEADRLLEFSSSRFVRDRTVIKQTSGCLLVGGRYEESPELVERNGNFLLRYGRPIDHTGSTVTPTKLSGMFESTEHQWGELDSSFLLFWVSPSQKLVKVITDRFNSRPAFFYYDQRVLALSTEYYAVSTLAKIRREPDIDPASVLEFLWFRRLFGDKTYERDIRLVGPGTELIARHGEISSKQYWRYEVSSELRNLKFSDHVQKIASSIQHGVDTSLGTHETNGLLLSGGLDSRAMLAAGKAQYVSISNAPEENNEIRIARTLAKEVASPHFFIKRPESYLGSILEEAIQASNGMTVYYECQFLGYAEQLRSLADNVQLGLFYDIFFCGHYLPKRQPSIAGRNALFFHREQIPDEQFIEYFFSKVSYRQKQTPLEQTLNKDALSSLLPSVKSNLRAVSEEGLSLGLRADDLWEYMHLNNLGRHYSMLMAKSLRPYIDVRLPALTNQNYLHAISMPSYLKRNWGVYIAALKVLADGTNVMNIVNSNTNINASYGLYLQTLVKFYRGFLKVAKIRDGLVTPSFNDRSWPQVNQSIHANRKIQEMIESVIEDGKLKQLGILDHEKVKYLYQETRLGRQDHSIFLNQLVTIEKGALNTQEER